MILIHKIKNNCGGLGDFIRSSIALYYLSKRLNFEYYIDMSNNINLDKCFIYKKYIGDTKNIKTITKIGSFCTSYDMIEYIKKLDDDIYFIITNLFGYVNINEINNILDEYTNEIIKPSDIVLNKINFLMEMYELKEKEYISCHIRCGDYSIGALDDNITYPKNSKIYNSINIYDINNYNKINEYIMNLIKNENKNIKIIIHSDSIYFKKKINLLYPNYTCMDISIKHITENLGDDTIDGYISTVAEFYILSKSKYIILPITYSGFSHWSSILGKINLYTNFNDIHIDILNFTN